MSTKGRRILYKQIRKVSDDISAFYLPFGTESEPGGVCPTCGRPFQCQDKQHLGYLLVNHKCFKEYLQAKSASPASSEEEQGS